MRESLREVSQGVAAMPGGFRVEATWLAKPSVRSKISLASSSRDRVVATGSGQRLDQPKRADIEGAFLSG